MKRRRVVTGCLLGGFLGLAVLLLATELDPYHEQGMMSIPELDAARDLSLAMVLYTEDSDDRFPPQLSTLTTPALLRPYLAHMPLHEFERSDGRELAMSGAGYTWNRELAGISETEIGSPTTTWLVRSLQPSKSGWFAVGFVDGHAKRYLAADLQKILKDSHNR